MEVGNPKNDTGGGLTQKGVSKGRAKKLGFMRLTPFWHTTLTSWLILAMTQGWQPKTSAWIIYLEAVQQSLYQWGRRESLILSGAATTVVLWYFLGGNTCPPPRKTSRRKSASGGTSSAFLTSLCLVSLPLRCHGQHNASHVPEL